MKPVILLSLILCATGCKEKPPVQPEMIWHSAPFGNVQIETIYPIFYKDKIIVSHNQENGSFILCALNQKDGSIAWLQRDTFASGKQLYYNLKPYAFRNRVVIPAGNRLMAFNMENGKKCWDKTLHEAAEDFLEGVGNTAFRSYYDLSMNRAYLYSINVETGNERCIHTFEIPLEYKAFYRTPAPIIDKNGDTVLVFTHISQELRDKRTYACLNWLNIKDKLLRTDTIYPVNTEGLGVTKQPLLDPKTGYLYLVSNDELVCYNFQSKTQQWRRNIPRDMLTSAPLTDKQSVFFPAEDGNLYALDKLHGEILWKSYTSGTPSRIFDDGVCIHVIGGGDGKWHIINKNDGKEEYLITSPNAVNYSNIFFRRAFTLHPDKNQAVLTDGKTFFYYHF